MDTPNSQPTPKVFSPSLFRLAGYGLLVLTAFDLGTILLPPRLMDPVWELEAIGSVIERIPVPLIAMVLIFFGETYNRAKVEKVVLKVLSWASLVFGIILLLFIPLGITNAVRIHNDNTTQIAAQFNQQVEQIAQLEQQVNQATPEQIAEFLRSQGINPNQAEGKPPKEQILARLNETKAQMQRERDREQSSRRNTLFERSIKWNLSALVAGFIFIYAWRLTGWARGSGKRKRSKAAKKVAPQPEA